MNEANSNLAESLDERSNGLESPGSLQPVSREPILPQRSPLVACILVGLCHGQVLEVRKPRNLALATSLKTPSGPSFLVLGDRGRPR